MSIHLLTTEQAAQRLGITTGRVRQLARAGGYGQRFGNAWAFSEDDLRTLALRKSQPGPVPQREIPNDPTTSQWSNRRLFDRDGKLYVCALHDSGDIGVWESTDNGASWHAPSEETLESLIS